MRFEREKEEEEISNIRNKNGLIDNEKLMRKTGFKERNINSDLVKKNTFSHMICKICRKILESQKLILKEIKFR